MSSVPDPAKLKVVELRAELSSRGLDTKGNKAVLVKRLKDALELELKTELPDTSIADTSTEDNNTSQTEEEAVSEKKEGSEVNEELKDEDSKEIKSVPVETVVENPSEEPEKVAEPEAIESQDEEMKCPIDKSDGEIKPSIDKIDEEKKCLVDEDDQELKSHDDKLDEKDEESKKEENGEQQDNVEEPPSKKSRVDEAQENNEEVPPKSECEQDKDQVKESSDQQPGEKRKRSNEVQKTRQRTPIKEDEPPIDSSKVQLNWYDSDLHLQIDKDTFLKAKPYHDGIFGYVWAGVRATHGANAGKVCFEVKVSEELKWEDVIKQPEKRSRDRDRRDSRRDKSRNDSKRVSDEKKDKTNEENGSEEKASGEQPHSDLPTGEEKMDTTEQDENKPTQEEMTSSETPVPEETSGEQSKDDSEIQKPQDESKNDEKNEEDKEGKEEKQEMESEETKDEQMDTNEKKEEEKEVKQEEIKIPSHLIRIGWSISSECLQLGESKYSYGFESSGKFVNNKEFTEYGKSFQVGDVIGTFLAFSEESINIIYTINGEELPLAVSIPRTELPEGDFSLFPHVLSKNYAFEVNFGDLEEPLYKIPEKLSEYKFINAIEEKVLGPQRPASRSDCEVIMMIGLPASGKTHWVNDYLEKNKEKRYTIIGNSQLLDKMTVDGTPFRNSIKPYWSSLMDKLTKTSNKLVDVASARRRNIVIDQTNEFHNTQRRKMRQFEGYKRRAIVVVCGEEEQAKRKAQYEEQQDTKLSNAYICQMKANMSLPRVGDWLEEVTYVELNEDDAKAMVQKYNKEGKDAGYGNWPRREARNNRFNKWQDNRRNDFHGGFRNKYPPHRYDRGPKQDYRSQRWGSNERRNNREQSRDWRSPRGSGPRSQDRARDRHNRSGSRDNYNRNRHQGGGGGGNWQGGGGGNWNRGSWNQGGSGGQWSQGGSGNWGGAWSSNQGGGSGKWNYNQGSQYGQPQQHGYGNGNYSGWNNFYGGGQNWNQNHGSNSSMSGNGH